MITTIITTMFKIDFIEEAIGIKRFINQRIRPTTTNVITTVISEFIKN